MQGKVFTGSTTMVTIQDESGKWVDITNKEDIESAIMKNNKEQYEQSFHLLFLQPPLVEEFGFKGLTPASFAVQKGIYLSEDDQNPHISHFFKIFAMPDQIQNLGVQSFEIPLETYKTFWKKVKEKTSCYPDN